MYCKPHTTLVLEPFKQQCKLPSKAAGCKLYKCKHLREFIKRGADKNGCAWQTLTDSVPYLSPAPRLPFSIPTFGILHA